MLEKTKELLQRSGMYFDLVTPTQAALAEIAELENGLKFDITINEATAERNVREVVKGQLPPNPNAVNLLSIIDRLRLALHCSKIQAALSPKALLESAHSANPEMIKPINADAGVGKAAPPRSKPMSELEGTMKCPICGVAEPHGHTEYEKELELNCRPAFLRWFLKACQSSRYALYYKCEAWGTARAVQRGGNDNNYMRPEVEAAWQCWKSAWFHEYPLPDDEKWYHPYAVPRELPKDPPETTRNVKPINAESGVGEADEAGQAKSTNERLATIERLYNELLYAVARKYKGESRHYTALRYIHERENNEVGVGKAAGVPALSAETKAANAELRRKS